MEATTNRKHHRRSNELLYEEVKMAGTIKKVMEEVYRCAGSLEELKREFEDQEHTALCAGARELEMGHTRGEREDRQERRLKTAVREEDDSNSRWTGEVKDAYKRKGDASSQEKNACRKAAGCWQIVPSAEKAAVELKPAEKKGILWTAKRVRQHPGAKIALRVIAAQDRFCRRVTRRWLGDSRGFGMKCSNKRES
ncbi:hypothetical protein NDU88_007126 [Pleurodeles waltl]|uniref:Uncharacterized protein n=1 Tax=Pleurodeles waltl TaxID=8319 RepID=A0AAV7QQY4_PLEWA|nr:hypothetical protein NDU88_007126 [Pleurodeles waltl]